MLQEYIYKKFGIPFRRKSRHVESPLGIQMTPSCKGEKIIHAKKEGKGKEKRDDKNIFSLCFCFFLQVLFSFPLSKSLKNKTKKKKKGLDSLLSI